MFVNTETSYSLFASPLRSVARRSVSLLSAALLSATLLLHCSLPAECAATDRVIDAVAASVNGEAITLRDVSKRLQPPRAITFDMLTSDVQARYVLDLLIAERLVEADAAAKHLQVPAEQIESYVDDVAERNGLSRGELEDALQREGKSIDLYRRQVRLEILRSKIASALLQGGAGVTELEIDRYLEDHPDLQQPGQKLKLSQILISSEKLGPAKAEAAAAEIAARLKSGENFQMLARSASDGAEAAAGGSLGVLAESDLSPLILSAVKELAEGELSAVTQSPMGYHIFRLEKRLDLSAAGSEALRDEIRGILQQQKLEERMQTYFSTELYEEYGVEKLSGQL